MSDTPANDAELSDEQALRMALQQLLQPLARLAVAKGMTSAQIEEQWREAFVQAAREAHAGQLAHRMVSRISTVTGLNRRLVTRLVAQGVGRASPRRSLAGEVYAHWLSSPTWRPAKGAAFRMKRHGPTASFEALAQEVTKDVHPRSLLDEMVRLGLVTWDPGSDMVCLVPEAMAVGARQGRLIGVLGNNVGDHLAAAVTNVLDGGGTHLERAIFAAGLSQTSLLALHERLQEQWQHLVAELVPELQALIERDGKSAAQANYRFRIGLFEFHEPTPDAEVGGQK